MNKKHLFIVGAGRSGTTFLWRILNNCLEVHLCTEIHYFSSLYHNGFLKNFRKFRKKIKNITTDDLFHCFTELKHFGMYWQKNPYFTRKEIENFFRDKQITEKSIYEFLFEHDLRLTDKRLEEIRYIGEKTPINVFHLFQLLKWFPEAKTLFIFRNPYNVLKSEANKPNKPDYPLKKPTALYYYGIVLFVFLEWLSSAFIALYYSAILKNDFHIVRYEGLSVYPETTVSRVCDKLDLSYQSKMCKVEKIGSSYSKKEKSLPWEPSRPVKLAFKCLTIPLFKLLNIRSL